MNTKGEGKEGQSIKHTESDMWTNFSTSKHILISTTHCVIFSKVQQDLSSQQEELFIICNIGDLHQEVQ